MVTLTRITGLKGEGSQGTYWVKPPCAKCGAERIYRSLGLPAKEFKYEWFVCDNGHHYPLFLLKGTRP